MTGTAGVEQTARTKARERRIAVDKKRVERERREERIEDAATPFFAGAKARTAGLARVEAAEDAMGAGVRHLLEAGLTGARAAELCEISSSQLKKLRARTAETGATRPSAESAGLDSRSEATP